MRRNSSLVLSICGITHCKKTAADWVFKAPTRGLTTRAEAGYGLG
jgi:hypothetical protein